MSQLSACINLFPEFDMVASIVVCPPASTYIEPMFNEPVFNEPVFNTSFAEPIFNMESIDDDVDTDIMEWFRETFPNSKPFDRFPSNDIEEFTSMDDAEDEDLDEDLDEDHQAEDEGDDEIVYMPRAQEEAEAEEEDEDEEVVVCPPCNLHEVLAKPLFTPPNELGECPICYENQEMVNVSVTRCGHVLHTSCLLMATWRSNDCPMCRTVLARSENNSDADSDSDGESEEDSDEEIVDEGEEEQEERLVTLDQLTSKITEMGYTTEDLVRLIVGYDLMQPSGRHTDDFIYKLQQDIYDIMDNKIPVIADAEQDPVADAEQEPAAGGGADYGVEIGQIHEPRSGKMLLAELMDNVAENM
jgi:hypothetical protein